SGARAARHADPFVSNHRFSALPGFDYAGPLERDPDQPARSAVLELRAVPDWAGPGHDVFGTSQNAGTQLDSGAAILDFTNLPARGDGKDIVGARCRTRFSGAGTDRSVPHADRKRRRALARKALALRARCDAASSKTEVRSDGTICLCAQSLLHALALHCRTPPTGQSKSRPPPYVLGAAATTANHERHTAYRADG